MNNIIKYDFTRKTYTDEGNIRSPDHFKYKAIPTIPEFIKTLPSNIPRYNEFLEKETPNRQS